MIKVKFKPDSKEGKLDPKLVTHINISRNEIPEDVNVQLGKGYFIIVPAKAIGDFYPSKKFKKKK